MSLSTLHTFVGTTRRLDGFERPSSYPHGDVRVKYRDAEGHDRYVLICPDGARLLAKALKACADQLDPPKKRAR